MPVSKTDFIRGLQCKKMLWLDSHAPELKIIPPEVQARLDAGNEFGDKAMSLFGAFTETTERRADGRLHYAAMLEKTQRLLIGGERVICEGSFSWYGNFCAADILKKDGAGYALYEVKNTPFVRKEFLLDLGFQRLIIKKCGVKLTSSFLVLNGTETEKDLHTEKTVRTEKGATVLESIDGIDGEQVCVERIEKEGEIYKIVDVTKQAKAFERIAQEQIFPLGKIKRKDAEMPRVDTGEHCLSPYPCWYFEHCHKRES